MGWFRRIPWKNKIGIIMITVPCVAFLTLLAIEMPVAFLLACGGVAYFLLALWLLSN